MSGRPAPAYPGFRCFVAVAAALAAAGAVRAADTPVFAPHPTLLVAEWKKERVPVVGAVSTDPVVRRNGKEERLRHDPAYFAERAPYYAPGRIEFEGVGFAGVYRRGADGGGIHPDPDREPVRGAAAFLAKLKSDTELKGAFLAIVVCNARLLDADAPEQETQIIVRALPDLPAGKTTEVGFQTQLPARRGKFEYLTLVFAPGGAEIESNLSHHTARYFAAVERAQLAVVRDAYLKRNPAANTGAQPVLRIQPALPAPAALAGKTVTATLTVSAAGLVEDLVLSDDVDPVNAPALRATLGGWLFLPKLENGTPVPARLAIPFKF